MNLKKNTWYWIREFNKSAFDPIYVCNDGSCLLYGEEVHQEKFNHFLWFEAEMPKIENATV